jgi:hypothetical protein
VAQLGSALPWGGRGRGFESRRSDSALFLTEFREDKKSWLLSGNLNHKFFAQLNKGIYLGMTIKTNHFLRIAYFHL